MDEMSNNLWKQEEEKIKLQKRNRQKKLCYGLCSSCKHKKPYSDYVLDCDKNVETIVIEKLHCVENPQTEEDEPKKSNLFWLPQKNGRKKISN